MTVGGIIQARLGSTRLPGKALLDIAGASMLARVVDRTRRTCTIDRVIVATTTKT
jgi:spore coat polysaccharide biosynthesis protein SpsF